MSRTVEHVKDKVWKFTKEDGNFYLVRLSDDIIKKLDEPTVEGPDEDLLKIFALLQEAKPHNNQSVVDAYEVVVTVEEPVNRVVAVTPNGPSPKRRAVSFSPACRQGKTPVHDISDLTNVVNSLSPFGKTKKKLNPERSVVHTKWGPKVKVMSLPPFSNEESIKQFFNEAASLYDILAPGDSEVVCCVHDLQPDMLQLCCTVEFSNEHYARRLCQCEPLTMEDSDLVLQQDMVTSRITLNFVREKAVRTEFVKISNAPQRFEKDHFLNNYLRGQCGFLGVLRVTDHNEEERTCRVEFADAGAASIVAARKDLVYDRCKLTCDQETVLKKFELQSTVIVSNLPQHLHLSHFETFLNETAILYRMTDGDVVAVKNIIHKKGDNTCRVEDPYIAEQMSAIKPFVYERMVLNLQQEEFALRPQEEEAGEPTSLIKFANLPTDFHKYQRSFLAMLAETAYQNKVCDDLDEGNIKAIREYSAQKGECTVECASSEMAKAFVDTVRFLEFKGKVLTMQHVKDEPLASTLPPDVDNSSSEIVRIEDVVNKAANKTGRKGGKFTWDQSSASTFLDVYLAYNKRKGTMTENQWEEVGAHLWLKFDLDVPLAQLKEKMKGLKNYFNGTVMKSQSGKDGTSTYPHYAQMLEVLPQYKVSIPGCSRRVSTDMATRHSPTKRSSDDGPAFKETQASMDKWDVNAVLLLLTEYQERQALFNSVAGTDRTIEIYKLVSIAMSNAQPPRYFTPEECKSRVDSLFQTFFTAKDFMSGQTGAGSIPMKRPIWDLLGEIHSGSVAVEPPLAFSVGASYRVKRGEVIREKVVGKGGKRPAKTWDWQKDKPLTTKQQQLSVEASKVEVSKNVLEEMRYIRMAREAREARSSNAQGSQ